MKNSNTQKRLLFIMDDRNLKQVDILNLCKPFCKKYNVKLNKSDLSQYISGKTEPNQDKLFILSRALKVSAAYLMGWDDEYSKWDNEHNKDGKLAKKVKVLDALKEEYTKHEYNLFIKYLELKESDDPRDKAAIEAINKLLGLDS